MDLLAEAGPAFAAIVDAAPAGVLVCGADGRILYANAALARMFGHGIATLKGRSLETLLPARYRHGHGASRAGFFAAPRPRAMGDGRDLFGLHADGHELPIEIGLGIVQYMGETCAIAFISDLTRRQSAEKRFATVVEALPFGLLMVDGAGLISLTNPALDRMFGYAPGELAGSPMERLLPRRLREKHPGLRDAYNAAPAVRAMGSGRDLMAQHKAGHEFPVEIALTPINAEAGAQVLAAVTDISIRKQHETAILQMNAQLEEFTYIASHDLRSPLRGIADLLCWIREDLDPALLSESVVRNFERADLRVARTEQMIEDLLDYARSGQTDGRITLTDPHKLVEDLLTLLPVPPHLSVQTDIRGSPFRCAATPLSLALRNLLNNAFKHHGKAQGRVRVAMREEGAYNIFTVEDDGVGVPAGADERIFKLFQRSTTSTPGHGVGLAVTKRAINAAGGTIELSRHGTLGGACFRIHWPRFPNKESDT